MTITISDSFQKALWEWSSDEREDRIANLLLGRHTSSNRLIDYLELEDGGMISYVPASKIQDIDGCPWTSRYRQAGKPARVARRGIADDYLHLASDSHLERFTYRCQNVDEDTSIIQIVHGDDILFWYDADCSHYCQSCMHGESQYLELYAYNPGRISMIIIREENEDYLYARALLWKAEDGMTYVDRIYGSDRHASRILDHAEEMGWRKAKSHSLRIPLQYTDFEYYPYMDTFKYLTLGAGVSNREGSGYDSYLDSTCGGGQVMTDQCDNCGVHYNMEENGGEGLCERCYLENVCEVCGNFDWSTREFHPTHGRCRELCESCAENTCEGCGTFVGYNGNLGENGLCEECQPEPQDEEEVTCDNQDR